MHLPNQNMTASNKTEFQIKNIMKYNHDGSPDNQQARHKMLMMVVKDLQSLGYGKRWKVHHIGKSEVDRLVHLWRNPKEGKGVANTTIANRLVHIRWLASKVRRDEYIPTNKQLGCSSRKDAPNHNTNKAVKLNHQSLEKLSERDQLITLLRAEFGLRTKEALKFNYQYATAKSGTHITLKGNWCKGGRSREIEIMNNRQGVLLQRVKDFQSNHREKSMIPKARSYKGYYKAYNEARFKADIAGHGLRHQWAQDRFKQVSGGIESPYSGDTKYKELSATDQARFDRAAAMVNVELGHGANRQDITSAYIGKG